MFPPGDKGLCCAMATAWEGRGLESPIVGLLHVGDGFIRVCTGFCIVLSRGYVQSLSVLKRDCCSLARIAAPRVNTGAL